MNTENYQINWPEYSETIACLLVSVLKKKEETGAKMIPVVINEI